MKQENEKKLYEAPALTAVTFKAEKGYASSITNALTLGLQAEATLGDQNIESRTTGVSWGSDW